MKKNTLKINARTLSKERRKVQLIIATIECISKKGLSGFTLSDVAKQAGLSQGIINLHFNSKENLLSETLQFLADEYDQKFSDVLTKNTDDPLRVLISIMEMDITPPILDRKKISVWFAFFGETKAQPTYQRICSERDQKYEDILENLIKKIIIKGNYKNIKPQTISKTLASLTDGIWLSYLINPKKFDQKEYISTINNYLETMFPKNY